MRCTQSKMRSRLTGDFSSVRSFTWLAVSFSSSRAHFANCAALWMAACSSGRPPVRRTPMEMTARCMEVASGESFAQPLAEGDRGHVLLARNHDVEHEKEAFLLLLVEISLRLGHGVAHAPARAEAHRLEGHELVLRDGTTDLRQRRLVEAPWRAGRALRRLSFAASGGGRGLLLGRGRGDVGAEVRACHVGAPVARKRVVVEEEEEGIDLDRLEARGEHERE